MISFFVCPVKTRKIFPLFFGNCLTIGYASFGEKKVHISHAIFTLISIKRHYCTISQNLFRPPFLNRINFSNYFKNVNVCMHVLQLWAKFHWKIPLGKWFFKFWSHYFFFSLNENSFFGRHFRTKHFFDCSFCWYMVPLGIEILTGKNSKMNGSKWTPPLLCTNGSEK